MLFSSYGRTLLGARGVSNLYSLIKECRRLALAAALQGRVQNVDQLLAAKVVGDIAVLGAVRGGIGTALHQSIKTARK
jgi:hypothetical protein